MAHQEKIEAWQRFAAERGFGAWASLTPADRALARVGLRLPPQMFWAPWVTALASGGLFAAYWAVLMNLTVWRDRPLRETVTLRLLAGVCFGLAMALIKRVQRRRLGVTNWADFGSTGVEIIDA